MEQSPGLWMNRLEKWMGRLDQQGGTDALSNSALCWLHNLRKASSQPGNLGRGGAGVLINKDGQRGVPAFLASLSVPLEDEWKG